MYAPSPSNTKTASKFSTMMCKDTAPFWTCITTWIGKQNNWTHKLRNLLPFLKLNAYEGKLKCLKYFRSTGSWLNKLIQISLPVEWNCAILGESLNFVKSLVSLLIQDLNEKLCNYPFSQYCDISWNVPLRLYLLLMV